MIGNIIKQNEEGTPQGSPMSPVLSNIVLDELDKELESRGHRFVRYADDFCIFVKSKRAGERVLKGISEFLEQKLKLKINQGKSGVFRPGEIKLLGYGFYYNKGTYRLRIHKSSYQKIKQKVKEMTRKTHPERLEDRITRLNTVIRGWVNYFKHADCRIHLQNLDCWLRRRLRYCVWEKWKRTKTRIKELFKLGASEENAQRWGKTRLGGWRICHSFISQTTLTNEYFEERGYIGFANVYSQCRKD